MDLPEEARRAILYGSGEEPVTMRYHDGLKAYDIRRPFEGVIPNMERRWRETDSSWVRDELSRFQTVTACGACGGHRLKPEALAVKIEGRHISEAAALSIDGAHAWFGGLMARAFRPKAEDRPAHPCARSTSALSSSATWGWNT